MLGKCGGRCGEGLAVTVMYCLEGETGMSEGVWERCGEGVWKVRTVVLTSSSGGTAVGLRP